jgi:hypothetical protein
MKDDYLDDFVGAMLRAGETPCERFSCAKQAECASQELACSAFRLYVHKGNAISPNTRLEISRGGRFKEIGWFDQIDATREHFDAAMRD